MGQRGSFEAFASIGRAACVAAGCLALAQCSSSLSGRVDPRYGVAASPRVVAPGEPIPKGGGVYRVGKPYTVAGRLYVPEDNRHYSAVGLASWYGDDFHGRLTANGEIFDMNSISAAHPTLPMPCYVRITNLRNGRSIVARVNDRGPYAPNRLIDVSQRTAKLLGFYDHGLTRVRVDYVGPAPLQGSDDRVLVATLRNGSPAPAPAKVMLASARPIPPVAETRPSKAESRPTPAIQNIAGREIQPAGERELTPAARVERTMGPAPGPEFASITNPSPVPSSAMQSAPADVSAYSGSGGRPVGNAFISGRGLY